MFDIGTGNPLGLLSTGIDCVKGIYNAYKTNDDDEFNTYITQPFLTSAEQVNQFFFPFFSLFLFFIDYLYFHLLFCGNFSRIN